MVTSLKFMDEYEFIKKVENKITQIGITKLI